MIHKINENELYKISISLSREDAKLPKHPENFKKRIGIKMISEDGTNFLQGFASYDVLFNENGDLIGDLSYLWTNPVCRGIGFGYALKENMIKIGDKYLEENQKKNVIDFNSNMDKVLTDKNENKNKSKKESVVKDKTEEKIIHKNESNENIGKSKCIHILNDDNIPKTDNETPEDFINKVTKSNAVCDIVATGKCNHIFKDNKDNITDKISEKLIKGEEITNLVKSINNPEAELPAIIKNTLELICVALYDDNENLIGFGVMDIYETRMGICSKLMNIFINEEFRGKNFASKILTELENQSIDFCKNINNDKDKESKLSIILANAVGIYSEKISSILKKNNYTLTGESRGRISFSKEL